MSNGNAYERRNLWTLINQGMQYHILPAYKICYAQPNNKSELSILTEKAENSLSSKI